MYLSLTSPKEFYEKFRRAREAYKMGQELGRALLNKIPYPKKDLETVVKLLNEFQKSVQGSPTASVQDGKIVMECSGFCPIMRAAISMNLPWLWLDENLALPMIRARARLKQRAEETLPAYTFSNSGVNDVEYKNR